MSEPVYVPYYDHQPHPHRRLIGYVTEEQAVLMVDVRLIRRKATGQLKRVIDRRDKLHVGEFGCSDVTSRPVKQKNDGKHYRQELESGWVYALKGRGI